MQTQNGAKENQNASDDFVECEHFRTKVAGRWYNRFAEAWPGTDVLFVHEPTNPHDRNAIAILNPAGARIGYLPRELAAKYAGLIDLGYYRLIGSLLHPCDSDFDDREEATNPTVEVWVEGSLSQFGFATW
jgi:HIRAN domain